MRVVARLGGHDGVVEAVAFSPDSSTLVTASSDGRLRWWHVPDGKPLGMWMAHKGGANGVGFGRTAKGETRLLSCGADHRVRVWSEGVGKESRVLAGHKGSVDTVALSPDGTRIASGGADRVVLVQETTGVEVSRLGGYTDRVSHLVFAPDGKRVATADADEQSVRVWDLACTRRGEPRPHRRFAHKGNVHGVDFGPDGRLLAAAVQRDGGVVIWDVDAGRRVDVPPGQAEYTWAVAFAPSGGYVAAGDYSFLKVWKVQR
jgi:WD40 repeat protein